MDKDRRYPRHYVEGMDIYVKSTFDADIEVLDISVSGCSVRSARRLSMGVEYIFKFEHEKETVSITGRVVWEKLTGIKKIAKDESMPIYTLGIEFGDITKDTEGIKKFIRDKVHDLQENRLSGIRVRIDAPEKAVLSHLETSIVKVISCSGMKMETMLEPSVDTIFTMEILLAKLDNSIHCRGRVAYCHVMSDEVPRRYEIGVEFLDMQSGDKSKLERFLDELMSAA